MIPTTHLKFNAKRCLRIILIAAAIWITWLYSSNTTATQDIIRITIDADSNIRQIAETYLQNPNLWIDILRANNLNSAHELRPGMTITIPVGMILTAERKLNSANEKIQEATKAGAKLFAADIIQEAVQAKEQASTKRTSGDLENCMLLADQALQYAEKALEISLSYQDMPAEAIVSFFRGYVHKKQPSGNIWLSVAQNEILIEGERIRTLSRSSADILFRDNSRLHLQENSQALIRRIRANLLSDTEEASVSLIEGDVLALLAGGGQEQQINLHIAGIETRFNSNNFYVSQTKEASRFANYEGEIEIQSAGVKVVLKENEGSVVPANAQPTPPAALLPDPRLNSPENGAHFHHTDITFSWEPLSGAVEYLIEFSLNAAFTKIISGSTVKQPFAAFPKDLDQGSYFWRVRALSVQGLPGRHSQVRFFRIVKDKTKPYLVVFTPENGAIITTETVPVAGVTDKKASVYVNGQPITVDSNGEFSGSAALHGGDGGAPETSNIVIRSINAAGNTTEIIRRVIVTASQEVLLQYHEGLVTAAPGHFLTAQPAGAEARFHLSGITEPLAAVSVTSQASDFHASTVSDEHGNFTVNLILSQPVQRFEVTARSMSGNSKQETITVEIDDQPPEIVFNPPIPAAISHESFTVKGRVKDGSELTVNHVPWSLMPDGAFEGVIPLTEGNNRLIFSAKDPAGNITLIEHNLVLDNAPPELLAYSVSPVKVSGGETVNITVTAQDATGLVKSIPYHIAINSFHWSGRLVLSTPSNQYQGSFKTPAGVSGKVILKSVTLSDYLGNRRAYAVQTKP